MLRIERSSNGGVVLSLSGYIEFAGVAELQRLLSLEAGGQRIVLDMRDVTLVDRNALKFLAGCESEGIELRNCPAYIRDWIDREADRADQPQ
jgi:anti-anti-sigma regulatory factor